MAPVRVEGSGRVSRLVDDASEAVADASDEWAAFSSEVHGRIVAEADRRVRDMLDQSNHAVREAAE